MTIHELLHRKIDGPALLFIAGIAGAIAFGVVVAKLLGILLIFLAMMAVIGALIYALAFVIPPSHVTYVDRRYVEQEPTYHEHHHYHHVQLQEPAQRMIEQQPQQWQVVQPQQQRQMVTGNQPRMISPSNQKRLGVKG